MTGSGDFSDLVIQASLKSADSTFCRYERIGFLDATLGQLAPQAGEISAAQVIGPAGPSAGRWFRRLCDAAITSCPCMVVASTRNAQRTTSWQ